MTIHYAIINVLYTQEYTTLESLNSISDVACSPLCQKVERWENKIKRVENT